MSNLEERVLTLEGEITNLKDELLDLQKRYSSLVKSLTDLPFGAYEDTFITDRVYTLEEQLDMLKERVDRIE